FVFDLGVFFFYALPQYPDYITNNKKKTGYFKFVGRLGAKPPYPRIKDLFDFGQPQGLSLLH
ncbi:MAG: hypothetical protein PUD24_01070, partial [Oscillospiraceae bacterium]|nr:hypothetical protein [Oscillospiraceae bacterium]